MQAATCYRPPHVEANRGKKEWSARFEDMTATISDVAWNGEDLTFTLTFRFDPEGLRAAFNPVRGQVRCEVYGEDGFLLKRWNEHSFAIDTSARKDGSRFEQRLRLPVPTEAHTMSVESRRIKIDGIEIAKKSIHQGPRRAGD